LKPATLVLVWTVMVDAFVRAKKAALMGGAWNLGNKKPAEAGLVRFVGATSFARRARQQR